MLIKYFFKNLNISLKKLIFFTKKINGLSLKNLLIYLNFNNSKISFILNKLFLYAINNIKNNFNIILNELKIHEISVGKGNCLKRLFIRSKGRANYYYKNYNNLKLILKKNG